MIVLLLFFLSGATALIYEVIWSKYLALMFGSTVQAQTVVLAVFMGGLALGNRLFGKRAAAIKQPLAVYGYIELLIGLYAFFFHSLYGVTDSAFIAIGSKFAENTMALLFLKGALSLGLLIVPTVLMGGTLPLLAAWLERRTTDAGRGSARFYSTNSLGAVFGAGVAGFYLVREWGMLASLQWAAFANLAVALAAVAISRQEGDTEGKPAASGTEAPILPARMACLLVAVTGGVSMGLEVLASRAVALVVGGSLQSFAIVLMAFIMGISLGAAAVASPRFSKWENLRTIFALLLTAAAVVGIFIWRVVDWAIFYSAARTALASTSAGYILHQFLVALMAIMALGIPAALLGAVLPMAIRAGSPAGQSLGDQVGRLLTWNTAGAVIGVMVTGFVLMPQIGLRGSFLVLALILAVIGAFGAWRLGSEPLTLYGGAVVVGIALVFTLSGEGWRHVLGSGIYRLRGAALTREKIEVHMKESKILFYKDAPDATVAVERAADPGNGIEQLLLRINGKADASTYGDLSTQYLLGHLPMMARPDSKDVFLLGLGGGLTAGAILGHPIDSLTIAENCGPVIEAEKFFEPWNRGPLTNARTHLRRDDARTVLKLSDKKYDIIISEPSNPWVVGIGNVFSQQFYQLCESRLKDGGIMAQWFHIYEMHDGIVDLVINTFSSVFPHMEVWDSQMGDIVLLGSMRPWESSPAVYHKVFEREQPRKDLETIGIGGAVAMLARQLASQRTSFAIRSGTAIQSDEFPVLEYTAPEAFYIGRYAERIFLFDERTRQSSLASELKQRTLRALPEPMLNTVFKNYGTSNEELSAHLRWRTRHMKDGLPHPVYDGAQNLPLIFRPPESYQASTNAVEPHEKLAAAEVELLRNSEKAPQAILEMTKIIEGEAADLKKKRRWNPTPFAASAVRFSINRGDFAQATKLIELGLKFDSADPELLYLQRLMEPLVKSKN
jgi:spermidine synthase